MPSTFTCYNAEHTCLEESVSARRQTLNLIGSYPETISSLQKIAFPSGRAPLPVLDYNYESVCEAGPRKHKTVSRNCTRMHLWVYVEKPKFFGSQHECEQTVSIYLALQLWDQSETLPTEFLTVRCGSRQGACTRHLANRKAV